MGRLRMLKAPILRAPVEYHRSLSKLLGLQLLVQRDDLLPFPLAGNKVRKVLAEIDGISPPPHILITTGAVNSNHCRTTAWIAATRGMRTHLVLHDPTTSEDTTKPALGMLQALGASYEIVQPDDISPALTRAQARAERAGFRAHLIAGGGHTPRGARACRVAAESVFADVAPEAVFVASGTGTTQGGLIAAARGEHAPRIIGVSVAREAGRGVAAVTEAARWAGSDNPHVEFDVSQRCGGYGQMNDSVRQAVSLGWRHGLPLDGTYTGKAFAALLARVRDGQWRGSRVLFWHTGGLWNHLSEPLG